MFEGLIFGVWDTGPWFGIKMTGNDFVGWSFVGGGTKSFDFNVNNLRNYNLY